MLNSGKDVLARTLAALLLVLLIGAMSCPPSAFAAAKGKRELVENSERYKNGVPIVEEPEDDEDGGIQLFSMKALPAGAKAQGVDVSHHQGKIDWQQVKNSGIDFAIIRCGYSYPAGGGKKDRYWDYNVSECERLGIPYGVYLYSYATNASEAGAEADFAANLIKGHNPALPVYFDMEDNSMLGSDYASLARTFCNKISQAGYTPGVYASYNWWTTKLTSSVFNNWDRWIARYNSYVGYNGAYSAWQYTSSGSVPGINGNVDMNWWYRDGWGASGVQSLNTANIQPGEYYLNTLAKVSSGVTAVDDLIKIASASQSDAQKFTFEKQGDGSFVIRSNVSGKVLDVQSAIAKNGAVVQLYDYNGSTAQRWYIRDAGEGYYIQSALGNWVIDLTGGVTSDGTLFELYAPNGTSAQKFMLSGTSCDIEPNSTVSITSNAGGNKAVGVRGASTSNSAVIELQSFSNKNSQLYRLEQVGNGVYYIVNVKSDKVVEIPSGLTANGSAVAQYGKNGTASQFWNVCKTDLGYRITNFKSGKSLDVPSGVASAGKALQIYDCNYTAAQYWLIQSAQSESQIMDAYAAEHAGDIADGTYLLNPIGSSNVGIDLSGIKLQTVTGQVTQQWKITHDAQGYVTITSASSGKVMDVPAGVANNGTRLQTYASNGTAAQKWVIEKLADGSYKIVSAVDKNKVFDCPAGSVSVGTGIQLYDYNGTAAQKWSFTSIDGLMTQLDDLAAVNKDSLVDGVYAVYAGGGVNGAGVLDVNAGSLLSGANVQVYASNGTKAQRWVVSHDSNGYIIFTCEGSGKSLDVAAGSFQPGTNVQQYAANSSRAQRWIAVPQPDGTYEIKSALWPNRSLDVYAGNVKANGSNVQLYTSNGSAAQRWKFVSAQ